MSEPNISNIARGKGNRISHDRVLDVLPRLSLDVEISTTIVASKSARGGHRL